MIYFLCCLRIGRLSDLDELVDQTKQEQLSAKSLNRKSLSVRSVRKVKGSKENTEKGSIDDDIIQHLKISCRSDLTGAQSTQQNEAYLISESNQMSLADGLAFQGMNTNQKSNSHSVKIPPGADIGEFQDKVDDLELDDQLPEVIEISKDDKHQHLPEVEIYKDENKIKEKKKK